MCSEGPGASWLSEKKVEHHLDNLEILGFQPWDAMPDVLASCEMLIAILEPEAGAFSVPSKVLSYHCAGRPILGALPGANLSSRIIKDSGSGLVVDPQDADAFVAAAERLMESAELRQECGDKARAYATQTFDVTRIGAQFEKILGALASETTTPA